jgi:hypothetical protein
MKTVAQVSQLLVEYGAATGTFSANDIRNQTKKPIPMSEGYKISDETYGRKSKLYISCLNPADRVKLERFLIDKGVKVNQDYWPGSCVVELQVSYFKGWHWDE